MRFSQFINQSGTAHVASDRSDSTTEAYKLASKLRTFRVNREDIVSLPHFSCLIGLGSSILFVIYLVDLFRMQKQRKADYNLQILTGRRKNFC